MTQPCPPQWRAWLLMPRNDQRHVVRAATTSGPIEANIEVDCLYGKVRFIRALVSYEAATVSALADLLAQYG